MNMKSLFLLLSAVVFANNISGSEAKNKEEFNEVAKSVILVSEEVNPFCEERDSSMSLIVQKITFIDGNPTLQKVLLSARFFLNADGSFKRDGDIIELVKGSLKYILKTKISLSVWYKQFNDDKSCVIL